MCGSRRFRGRRKNARRRRGRRLCFDTESDYFKPDIGIWEIEDHREYMKLRIDKYGPIRFDCAVVYDEENACYKEFDDAQASSLVAMLATADELISHSGKRHDLLVLEQVCGCGFPTHIWQIRHRDLLDVQSWASVESLARQYVSGRRLAEWKDGYTKRIAEADRQWPELGPGFRPHEHFVAYKLAKARFDVERTYAIRAALSNEGRLL